MDGLYNGISVYFEFQYIIELLVLSPNLGE